MSKHRKQTWRQAHLSSCSVWGPCPIPHSLHSRLQVLLMVATHTEGTPAASQWGPCSGSGSSLELLFLSSYKQKYLLCLSIGLCSPSCVGVGSCQAAREGKGSLTALHNGRGHVSFPLALDWTAESFGDVLKFRLQESQEGKAQ